MKTRILKLTRTDGNVLYQIQKKTFVFGWETQKTSYNYESAKLYQQYLIEGIPKPTIIEYPNSKFRIKIKYDIFRKENACIERHGTFGWYDYYWDARLTLEEARPLITRFINDEIQKTEIISEVSR